jgi:oxygen-independent coproporphyrinogen-3 oxidase
LILATVSPNDSKQHHREKALASDLPAWLWPRAAYVHIPFCAHHCGYCDFAIATGRDHLIGDYLDALGKELKGLAAPQTVETLFVGGGTPTHLSPGQLERLLGMLREWLPLAEGGEFSIEANPDTLTPEKVAVLGAHGVNRVSLGAQSFHPHLLRALERAHSAAEIPRAVERVRSRIGQVSLDLIFAVPGQSTSEWVVDIQRALELGPDHVSTYGLTYETGTPLWKRRRRGEVQIVGEDDELEMYRLGIETLEGAGFEHYEISNFARPGRRSRHNQVYWANEAYFGFGMGAARYVLGKRELNTRDLHTYLARAKAGQSPTLQSEELGPEERARETLAVQLRRSEGVQRGRFRVQTGFEVEAVASPRLASLVEQGFLAADGEGVRLTRAGKYVADGVVSEVIRVG